MRLATIHGATELTGAIERGGFRYRAAMLTLTYAQDESWRPRHLSELTDHVAKWLERHGHKLRCVWVLELTARGRPHYHLCIWLPQGLTLPKPDKQGWWRHGSTRIEWARRAVGYLAKYASKGTSGDKFPKGARIHGRCGLDAQSRRVVAWRVLPRYVREVFPEVGAWVVRAYGGGWVDRGSGEWLEAWHPPPVGA